MIFWNPCRTEIVNISSSRHPGSTTQMMLKLLNKHILQMQMYSANHTRDESNAFLILHFRNRDYLHISAGDTIYLKNTTRKLSVIIRCFCR